MTTLLNMVYVGLCFSQRTKNVTDHMVLQKLLNLLHHSWMSPFTCTYRKRKRQTQCFILEINLLTIKTQTSRCTLTCSGCYQCTKLCLTCNIHKHTGSSMYNPLAGIITTLSHPKSVVMSSSPSPMHYAIRSCVFIGG